MVLVQLKPIESVAVPVFQCLKSLFGLGAISCTEQVLIMELKLHIFSCDQAAIWLVQSVCLSVCLSVRPSVTPFSPCSHHRVIMKFSGAITNDKCDVHAKGQGQRSKVKVTEVNTQLNRFRTVTPVWIHIWWWNDAYSLMMLRRGALLFLAATKQLYKWYFPSVRPSVRLSVTPFGLCSHHRIIMKFSGVITNDQSKVHAKGQGQRSKVKVTEVTTQLNRFRTVTPVWIHIWWWNDAYSLMLLRRGALLFFKVIRQISRSHGSKKHLIWPKLAVSGL